MKNTFLLLLCHFLMACQPNNPTLKIVKDTRFLNKKEILNSNNFDFYQNFDIAYLQGKTPINDSLLYYPFVGISQNYDSIFFFLSHKQKYVYKKINKNLFQLENNFQQITEGCCETYFIEISFIQPNKRITYKYLTTLQDYNNNTLSDKQLHSIIIHDSSQYCRYFFHQNQSQTNKDTILHKTFLEEGEIFRLPFYSSMQKLVIKNNDTLNEEIIRNDVIEKISECVQVEKPWQLNWIFYFNNPKYGDFSHKRFCLLNQ